MDEIRTGVDKLLDLITMKKKVSYTAASKALGMPKEVIVDWADVLEENGIIAIEYFMFKPFMVLREFSEKEVRKRLEEFKLRKDNALRRVDFSLTVLKDQDESLRRFKDDFSEIKNSISSQIEHVKKDLVEMDKIDNARHQTHSSINKHKSGEAVLDKKRLDSLMKRSKAHETDIRRVQDNILSKINSKKSGLTPEKKEKIMKKMKEFFDKKNEINKLLENVEAEYAELKKEIAHMRENAKNVTVNSPETESHLKEMESKVKELEMKKNRFMDELFKMNKLLVGV